MIYFVPDKLKFSQLGSTSAGSEAYPANLMPPTAQYSSFSDVSPLMPTAPIVNPSLSSIRTPPATGINLPSAVC